MRRMDQEQARRVRQAVMLFASTGHGDFRKLRGVESEWRLRVGAWRVRVTFVDGGKTLLVLRILPRSEAYR
ncbi:MAG: type II toxin-antitoxin system mRNA interferase toxin, RelE/StbE family [Chloroflexi bacterium]|nr:type II toxin-antitoxin system mRNA interferase toxin, RelE/StbE family [Chloroflexota bacterium]